MPIDWTNALIGGAIIGIAVSLMLLLNGRVTGISGIIYGLFTPNKNDILWRVTFILGLFIGGVILSSTYPTAFEIMRENSPARIAIAGLLVGFGTILGSGCTSGHGVCGISRLSIRSILATITFISAGVLTIITLRALGVIS